MLLLLACAASTLPTSEPALPTFHQVEGPCFPELTITVDLETTAPYGLTLERVYSFGPRLPTTGYQEEGFVVFSCGPLDDPRPGEAPAGLIAGYRVTWLTAVTGDLTSP